LGRRLVSRFAAGWVLDGLSAAGGPAVRGRANRTGRSSVGYCVVRLDPAAALVAFHPRTVHAHMYTLYVFSKPHYLTRGYYREQITAARMKLAGECKVVQDVLISWAAAEINLWSIFVQVTDQGVRGRKILLGHYLKTYVLEQRVQKRIPWRAVRRASYIYSTTARVDCAQAGSSSMSQLTCMCTVRQRR
jgi:hypothetical protein